MKYPTAYLAENFPDQPVVIDGSEIITHAGLERRIVDAARRLRTLGVTLDDRVALFAPNSVEWIVIAHAVARVGAILLPVNTRLVSAEILVLLEQYQPRVILTGADTDFALGSESAWSDRLVRLGNPPDDAGRWWSKVLPAKIEIGSDVDPQRTCTIISTSGTTGTPKGVCLSLANHLAAAEASGSNLHSGPADRWLVNLPFFHVGGLSIIYRSVVSRIVMVLHRRFSVDDTIDAIERLGITHLSLVENTLRRLLDAWGERRFPPAVRGVLIGGGPIDIELLRRARRLGLPVLPTYGLTEAASQVATLSPNAPHEKLTTAGRPLPTCEIELRDSTGHTVLAGVAGEIAVRGPMVSRRYWMPPNTMSSKAMDGWCATGDIGVFDDHGYLTILGRADDMIISGGEKFFPSEIEACLAQIPQIHDVAVMAVDEPRWGRVPVAFIEFLPGESMTPNELVSILAGKLASYKIPKQFITVGRLPRTEAGKIDRRRLADTRPHTPRDNSAL